MMQLTRDTEHTLCNIKSYEAKQLVINDITYKHSVIVTPNAVEPWSLATFSELNIKAIEELLAYPSEIILIGTGQDQHFPPAQFLAPLIHRQIGFEVMSTLAACSTFRILAAEGRSVTAGLIV
jgi:uncharacterized protein